VVVRSLERARSVVRVGARRNEAVSFALIYGIVPATREAEGAQVTVAIEQILRELLTDLLASAAGLSASGPVKTQQEHPKGRARA
jgi:hypothetical protein